MKPKSMRTARNGLIAVLVLLFAILIAQVVQPEPPFTLSQVIDPSCTPICVYGLKPGETPLAEATKRLSQYWYGWQIELSVLGQHVSLESASQIKEGGRLRWPKTVFDAFGSGLAYYDYAIFATSSYTQPMLVAVNALAARTTGSRLNDYISLLGQPSNILPVLIEDRGIGSTNQDYLGAYLIYPQRGFAIFLQPVSQKSAQNMLDGNPAVQSFISYVPARADVYTGFNGQLSVPWKGQKSLSFYCDQIPTLFRKCS